MHFEIHTGSLSLNCFFGPVGMNPTEFWNIILFITLASYCVLEWCLSNQETSLLSSTTRCFKKKKKRQGEIRKHYPLRKILSRVHAPKNSKPPHWYVTVIFLERKLTATNGKVLWKPSLIISRAVCGKRERERERDLSCRINTHTQQWSSWNEQKLFPMKSAFTTQPSSLFCIYFVNAEIMGFLGGSDTKESSCNAEDLDLIPKSGRSPEEGNGNPLQYSCLGNPMDRGAWWATIHGVAKSWTQLSD